MATQEGPFQIVGKMGNMVYYKTKNGYKVRSAPGKRSGFKNNPAYSHQRQNAGEFGRAAKAGRLFRMAFREFLIEIYDPLLSGRLTRELLKVIKSDPVNEPGDRRVEDGFLHRMVGFEFNPKCRLDSRLLIPAITSIDRKTGKLSVDLRRFYPCGELTSPEASTHFIIILAAAEIDFEREMITQDIKQTVPISLSGELPRGIHLECSVSQDSMHPIFLVLGIQFFKESNGKFNSMKKDYALQIAKVSKL